MDIYIYIYTLILTMFFLSFAVILFFVGRKGLKTGNRHGASSTFACSVMFILFALYNEWFGLLPYPLNGFLVWWIGAVGIVNIIFIGIIKREIKIIKKAELENSTSDKKFTSKLRNYVAFLIKGNPYKDSIPVKMEIVRKSFHVLGFLIVIAYYGAIIIPPLTLILNNLIIEFINNTGSLYTFIWGNLNDYPYKIGDLQSVVGMTLFILIGALSLATMVDSIRNIMGPQYSILNVLTRAVLRKKELNASGPQIHLITAVTFTYLLYIMGLVTAAVVFTALSISCISDALAAVVGRRYGKHQITCRRGEVKSKEGFLVGSISAYLLGLLFIGPIYALIAAIIFLLIDYFPSYIADNILNPILITVGVTLFAFFSHIPMGWNWLLIL